MTRPNDPSAYSPDPLAEIAAHGSQDGRQRVTPEYVHNNHMHSQLVYVSFFLGTVI